MSGATTPFAAVRAAAVKLTGGDGDYDALLERVGARSLVLLGEATHGTREFYRLRAEITRRLVTERGFDAVAIEGDWPDVERVNRYVRGRAGGAPAAALADFARFPAWMWRNRAMEEFVAWLQAHNAAQPAAARAGVYGLDLYSLYRSADAVVAHLETLDAERALEARRAYAGLDHVRDPQRYGYEAAFGLRAPCRAAAQAVLAGLATDAAARFAALDPAARDAAFSAERNARVVLQAESYYRAMFGTRISTWNLRDAHMTETLFALRRHLRAQGGAGKIVVWAHNSHLGDARATEPGWNGEHNLGQLVRERAGADDALLVGFTTYTGHVSAAPAWGAPVERRWVRPALADSYEHLFHRAGLDRLFLDLHLPAAGRLREILLERAIGVVYRPEAERLSHYFRASLRAQFDALFHLDETTAVEPLEPPPRWRRRETPPARAEA